MCLPFQGFPYLHLSQIPDIVNHLCGVEDVVVVDDPHLRLQRGLILAPPVGSQPLHLNTYATGRGAGSSDAGGYLLSVDPLVEFRARLPSTPAGSRLPNLSTTFLDTSLEDNAVIHPIYLDDDAPLYSLIRSSHMESCASCLRSRG